MGKRANPQKADVGKAIVFLADRQGMKQSELAKKARVSDKAISGWCMGLTSPSRGPLQAVLQALDCTWQDVEEVMAFHLLWRLKLQQRREAKQVAANSQVDERSGPAQDPGPSGSASSLGLLAFPGPPTPSADDDRFREIGHLFSRLHDLVAQPPDRKSPRRR